MKQNCEICKKEFELPNESGESYPRDPRTTKSGQIQYICPECSRLTGSM